MRRDEWSRWRGSLAGFGGRGRCGGEGAGPRAQALPEDEVDVERARGPRAEAHEEGGGVAALGWVFVGILVLLLVGALALTVAQVPEIKRYKKIKSY